MNDNKIKIELLRFKKSGSDMVLDEKKEKLLSQKRLYSFDGEKGKYIYDAFSQNIFPVDESIFNYFFSESSESNNSYSLKEKQNIKDFINYLDTWTGKIQYTELSETHLTINLSNKCLLICFFSPTILGTST